jgi:hypothetical protein
MEGTTAPLADEAKLAPSVPSRTTTDTDKVGRDTSPVTQRDGVRSSEKEPDPSGEIAPELTREQFSARRFVIQASQTLARFDPEAVQDAELNELRDHLQELLNRANWLLEKVETRLKRA